MPQSNRNQKRELKVKSGEALLRFLHQETIFGHGEIPDLNWHESAALIDQTLAVPGNWSIERLKRRLEANQPNSWTCTLQVAEATPIPREFDIDLVGATQMAFIDAADQLPGIAQEANQPLIMALTEYGLGDDSASVLLKQLIYDYTTPDRRQVSSLRLDTVGGVDRTGQVAITEAQIAMAGWSHASRTSFEPGLVGTNRQAARIFIQIMRELTGRSNPTIALVVEAGIAKYWQEINDFRLVLAEISPESKVFAVSNGGLSYDRARRILYYVNACSGACEPLDVVYTVADARRLLSDGMFPLLEAVRAGAVILQPTLNPWLNNYHLLRALIYHQNPVFSQLFSTALARTGVDNPEQTLQTVKQQTIPMSLVDPENSLDLEMFGFAGDGHYPWEKVIADLKRDDKKAAILSEKKKKELVLRILLSTDLGLLSGGAGSKRLRDFLKPQLVEILELAYAGMKELRETGVTDKPIVGLEPLVRHRPQRVRIYNFSHNGRPTVEKMATRQRFCPVYARLGNEEHPQLVAAFSFFSRAGTSYKLGGDIYAVGPHYIP